MFSTTSHEVLKSKLLWLMILIERFIVIFVLLYKRKTVGFYLWGKEAYENNNVVEIEFSKANILVVRYYI